MNYYIKTNTMLYLTQKKPLPMTNDDVMFLSYAVTSAQ